MGSSWPRPPRPGFGWVVPDVGGAADLARGGRGLTYPLGDADACAKVILNALSQAAPIEPATTSYSEDHFVRLFELYEGLVAQHPSGLSGD